MPPEEFNSVKLGGSIGIVKQFPFTFMKDFDCVAEIENTGKFSPSEITWKQLLGQFESSQTVPPGELFIHSNFGN
jgi:hypothetical protein